MEKVQLIYNLITIFAMLFLCFKWSSKSTLDCSIKALLFLVAMGGIYIIIK